MTLYLDRAATTPVRREVLEAMWPYLTSVFGNPSSVHEVGAEASDALRSAVAAIAAALDARPGEIVLTSGGTEGDNTAVKGIALGDPRGRHVVTIGTEHEAVLASCDYLERLHGFEVTIAPVDAFGVLSPEALAGVLRPDTTLVTVAHANNEIGTVQDIPALAAVAHAVGARFHTDAVQSAPWLPVGLGVLGVDAVSVSGHKLGAPKGTGALAVRAGTPVEPLVHGGGQQRGLRSGTEDVAGAVGLATALTLAARERDEHAASATAARDVLVDGVLAAVPGALLTGSRTARLPGHASFCLPGVSGESVLLELERRGIVSSSGSACAAGSTEPSHVLRAIGVPDELAGSAIRMTFDGSLDAGAASRVAEAVVEAVRSVRGDAPGVY
jgi:cysteine desulfurase